MTVPHSSVIICSMKRALIYCRISSDPLGEGKGVERQEEDCRELAESRGYQIVDILIDNDTSAFKGRARPKYQQMVELVRSGSIDVIVAWHPDRLHRDPRELEDFIDLVDQAKCSVETVREGVYSLDTPAGRGIARIVGAIATSESEHKSARLKRKHEQLAQEGKISGGGTRPFGFEHNRLDIREDEAKLIRSAVQDVIDGRSIRSIARQWKESGVPSVTGAEWTPHVIRRLLMSGRIAGIREKDGEIVATAVWPAIISVDNWRTIRAILLDPGRRKNRRARRYLLTGGVARCALCGANLVARPKSDHRPCYVCASDNGGCGKIRCLAEPLDEAVTQMAFIALDGPSFKSALYRRVEGRNDSASEILDEIRRCDAKLEELSVMFVNDEIRSVDYSAQSRVLRDRLEDAQRRLALVEGNALALKYAGSIDALRGAWPTMAIDDRRLIIGSIIDHVPVGPAVKGRNFFDATRIGQPVWRV